MDRAAHRARAQDLWSGHGILYRLAVERRDLRPAAVHGVGRPDTDFRDDGRAELRARLVLHDRRLCRLYLDPGHGLLGRAGAGHRDLGRAGHGGGALLPAPRAQVRPRAGIAGHFRPGLHRGRAGQAVLRRLPGRLPRAAVPELRGLPRVRRRLPLLPPADGRRVAGHVRRDLPAAVAHPRRHRGALGHLSSAHGRGAGPQRATGVHERVRRGRGHGRPGRRGGRRLLHHQPQHGAGTGRAGVRGGGRGRAGLARRRHDRLAADRPDQLILGRHRRQSGHAVRPVRRRRVGRERGRIDDGEDIQPGGDPALPADAGGAAGQAFGPEGEQA